MSKPKFYITTAIPYANGAPHIGHAYERIATDATRVVNEPAFREKYVTAAGLEVMNAGPDAFAEMVRADRASYAQRVKALGNVKID